MSINLSNNKYIETSNVKSCSVVQVLIAICLPSQVIRRQGITPRIYSNQIIPTNVKRTLVILSVVDKLDYIVSQILMHRLSSFSGETETLPPCPILLLMSTSGELCPYRVINDVSPPRVINQPAIPLPADRGRRTGDVKEH